MLCSNLSASFGPPAAEGWDGCACDLLNSREKTVQWGCLSIHNKVCLCLHGPFCTLREPLLLCKTQSVCFTKLLDYPLLVDRVPSLCTSETFRGSPHSIHSSEVRWHEPVLSAYPPFLNFFCILGYQPWELCKRETVGLLCLWTADISPSLRSLSGVGRLSDCSLLKLRFQDVTFCLLAKKFQGQRSFREKGR